MTVNNSRSRAAGLSRRGLLGGAAVAGMAVGGTTLLAGCGADDAPATSTTGTLRVGHYGWVGNLMTWLPDLKKKFEEKNEGVTVEIIPVPSSEATTDALVQKLSLEARQGKASYDLLLGPTPWIEVGSLAKAGAILAVDDIASKEWLDKVVEPARAEATSGDGKMYALPFWADVVGFMDRPDLQAQHGLKAPQTWDDLVAQAEAGGLPSEVFPSASDWTSIHRYFLPILAAYADRDTIFADNGTVDMSTPEALKALEILKKTVKAMPSNALQPGKHLESFYAGAALSQSYWQSGYMSAQRKGLKPEQLTYRKNLTGDKNGTFLWNTAAVIPKASGMPEVAGKFITHGIAGDWGLKQSVEISSTIPPMSNLESVVELPPHLKLAYTSWPPESPCPPMTPGCRSRVRNSRRRSSA